MTEPCPEQTADRKHAPVPHPRDAPTRQHSGADDMAGLPYYTKLARRWRARRIMPKRDRIAVAKILMDKAHDLAAARRPYGPIRNPAAAFVAWAETLYEG